MLNKELGKKAVKEAKMETKIFMYVIGIIATILLIAIQL
jgi:hypothetical protein